MLVKDEHDIIEHSLRWLLTQVDTVFVADNGSTDGTRELVANISVETGRVRLHDDTEVGYFQDRKMTAMARTAHAEGYEWGVPVDADEFWRCADSKSRIGDHLAGIHPDYRFAAAALYHHKVTSIDGDNPNPSLRLSWRFREPSRLPKIAVRLDDQVEIGMGNHEATSSAGGHRISSTGSPPLLDHTLIVEHYPWRSREQFATKIANGARSAAAARLDEQYVVHWRAFGMPDEPGFEDRVHGWFDRWAYASEPERDAEILYSPFPV